jgi:hypothetical protein
MNTRENERYFRLSKAATDGEKDGNIDKVIRKVAKQVVYSEGCVIKLHIFMPKIFRSNFKPSNLYDPKYKFE